MGVNAFDIKLLNGSAQEISYYNVETVTFPEASGSGVVKFTAGEPLDSSFVQIAPDFTSGDMLVDAPTGYVVRDALVLKPSGMEAVIAKGASLMGVDGSYVTPGTSKSVTLDFASGSMSISAVGDERWAQIDIAQPATLLPENIKKSVTVAGIVGSYVTPGTTKAVTLDFSSGDMSIAAVGDERWNEIDIAKPSTLTPGNIAEGVEVAGIVGSMVVVRVGDILNKTLTILNDDTIISVPSSYFSGFAALRTVNLPNCINIGSSAFLGCTSLTTVSMPSVSVIPMSAFSGCISLQSLNALSCESIGANAFANCGPFEGDFPLCSYIGAGAFSSCGITMVSAPSCKTVGTSAFVGCNHLSMAYFPACETINSNAFNFSCNADMQFGSSITSVGVSAFGTNACFTSLYLGNCSYIGTNAFQSCNQLSIGFDDYSSLNTIYRGCISTNNIYVQNNGNGLYYDKILIGASGAITTISAGTKVILGSFPAGTFTGAVTIPDSVEVIGAQAFDQRLKSFTSYSFPNLRVIGNSAFSGCFGGVTSSISIIAPNLSIIGNYGFGGGAVTAGPLSSRLSQIQFSSLLSVGDAAFSLYQNTEFLTSVFTLTYVGSSAFQSCAKLSAKIRIKSARVATAAFRNCILLKTVVLDNCASLLAGAFTNCSYLASVYVFGRVPGIASAAVFASTPMSRNTYGGYGSIYVAASLYSALSNATYWSAYKARLVSITAEQEATILEEFE